MGKDLDSGPLDGDDPGRRGGVAGVGDEIGIVGRDNHTKDEDTNDVEEEDTDPDTTNGEGDVLGRVASFGGGHPENLSSQEGVGSTDQDRPNTGETSQRSWDIMVLNESTGVTLRKVNSVILLAGFTVTVLNIPSSGIQDGHG